MTNYIVETPKTTFKIMGENFQDVAQKVQHNKNPDTFAAQFPQYFNQKLNPQKCHRCMEFKIMYMVSPIGLIKTWVESS